MLIALFTILFLGGSDTGMLDFIADSQDTVKVVMEKDDRRKEVLASCRQRRWILPARRCSGQSRSA